LQGPEPFGFAHTVPVSFREGGLREGNPRMRVLLDPAVALTTLAGNSPDPV